MGGQIRYRLLGRVEVDVDGEPLAIGGGKARTLLAVLLLNAHRVVSTDRLIDAMWGESPPASASHAVHVYVSRLRTVLPDGMLISRHGGYLASPQAGELDVTVFNELCEEARRHATEGSSADAARLFEEALAQWRGPALADVADGEALRSEAARLDELRLSALEAWFDVQLAAGDGAGTIVELSGLVAEHPLRERFRLQLALALYRAGRQAEALGVLADYRDLVREDLGLDPTPELQDLERRILDHDPSLAWSKEPDAELRDLGEHHLGEAGGLDRDPSALKNESTPTNLPSALQSIVGRDDDLAVVADELRSSRLVTVVGVGGAGKTTLAVEVARAMIADFPDGVWLVELTGLTDGTQIATEILGAARKPATAGRDHSDVLTEQLSGQRALLVLDNCEHLIADVAAVVSRVLRSTESVVVLATSREPMTLGGETVWRIPVLSLPGNGSEEAVLESGAGQLFADRARAADATFEVDGENAETVARMCRQLDGLPLAIELACARLRSMSLSELDRRLDDRFRILRGGSPDLVPHHRTLHDTVAWSYDLLSESEQRLYTRLSVFAGGFDLAAAEALAADDSVFGDVLDGLDHLVAQSLVQHQDGRYRMLETIREFARELLVANGDYDEAASAHLAWMKQLATTGARNLEGKDQPVWMARFKGEIDNIRAALSWALHNDPVTGANIASALTRFFWMNAMETDTRQLTDARSFLDEGYDWATKLLDAAGADFPPKNRARLQSGIGGLLCVRAGRYEEAIERLSEARSILGEVGDHRLLGWALFYDGIAGWGLRPLGETIELFLQAKAHHEEAEDLGGRLFSTVLAALAMAADGRHDESREPARMFVDTGLQSRVPTLVAHALDTSAWFDALRDEVEPESLTRAAESLEKFQGYGNYACATHALAASASVLARTGDREGAAIALGIAEGIRDHLSMVIAPYEDRTTQVLEIMAEANGIDVTVDGPDRNDWDAARHQGRTMAPDEGIAWAISRLGQVAMHLEADGNSPDQGRSSR